MKGFWGNRCNSGKRDVSCSASNYKEIESYVGKISKRAIALRLVVATAPEIVLCIEEFISGQAKD